MVLHTGPCESDTLQYAGAESTQVEAVHMEQRIIQVEFTRVYHAINFM